ncbi:MAG: pentapeptide repeat-containing protein, partial [Trichormus sp.]
DIYVPLAGVPQTDNDQQPVDLKTWVEEQLTDLASIAVIVSEPGYGKTSFCQMWAAEVARELYPAWMPIVIQLREIRYSQNFIETLNSGFAFNQYTHLGSWLAQHHPRCVLLLDGLDELPPTSQTTKRAFIQQLMQFQAQHQHKIVLTSRPKTVQELASEIPLQWRQINIEPLKTNELRQWFQQWTLIQSLPVAQNFFTFLKQAGLFARKSQLPALSALVHQPLMLYLLGVLHRDGLLDDGILQLAQTQPNANSSLLWEIYRRLQKWLLGYPVSGKIYTSLQRSGWAHIHRTQEAIANLLAGDHPQEIIQQIQTISLQILHSDRYYITLESTPKTNLPPFYFHRQQESREAVVSNTQTVAFSHSNLGTYLCAEAVASQLQMLTQCQTDIYGTQNFVIDSHKDVAQHLYKLLGYGILTPEITKLAIASLRNQPQTNFSWQVIMQRLEFFWRSYYQGRWLDEGIAHTALSYFHKLENPVNVERINTYVGINIFLLLAQIHKEIQITFSPCGNQNYIPEFYPEAMLMLLAKVTFLGRNVIEIIHCDSLAGINLAGASLAHIMLAGANFEQTNLANAVLTGANLSGANLTDVNLTSANLSGANLTGANLTGANLSGANLTGANLTNVNIYNVNFTNTCLSDAIISETDREALQFQGALFSLEQFQALQVLLSQQSLLQIYENTEQTEVWENQDDIGMIESVEGELMLSTNFDEDGDDATVFNDYFRNS